MMYRGLALALVTALTASLCQVVSAQQPYGIARLGFLGPPPLLEVFRNAVATLGYAEGRTVMIDARWPPGDRLDLFEVAVDPVATDLVVNVEACSK